MRELFWATCLLASLSTGAAAQTPTRADDVAVPHEPPSARDTALDFTLSALRFDNLAQRRRLDWWLLGWGLVNPP